MSWFGDTFGDSLNSIKGQITKITKEVLADDEATNSERQESDNQLVKELEALCESKDLEIAALRDEFNKLSSQCTSEAKIQSQNCQVQESSNTLALKNLEKEVTELRQERDHLNSCVEALQAEHQVNLEQVLSLKNKYKSELEELSKEFNSFKASISDSNSQSITDEKELNELRLKIKDLQLLFEKEKEQSLVALTQEKENHEKLKSDFQKLLDDIQKVIQEKEGAIEEKTSILNENKNLKLSLEQKEKENQEYDIKLKLVLNEKEDLFNKYKTLETIKENSVALSTTNNIVFDKLQSLLKTLNIDCLDITGSDSNDFHELFSRFECKITKKFNEINGSLNEYKRNSELELEQCRQENKNLQNQLKIAIKNTSDLEKKYEEETSCLRNTLNELKHSELDCISQSQTDDVKRLEQELAQCMSQIHSKNSEINDYSNCVNELDLKLKQLKLHSSQIESELLVSKEDKEKLENEIMTLNTRCINLNNEKSSVEKNFFNLESENKNLCVLNNQLQNKIQEMEKELEVVKPESQTIKDELEKVLTCKTSLEKQLKELQNENNNLKNEFANIKADVIVKESSLAELMKANSIFQEEMNKLQLQNNQLANSEKEVKKWKDASVDLQIQLEDLIAKKDELEMEVQKLSQELEVGLSGRDSEIEQLKMTNANLMKSCNELHYQLETKVQGEQSLITKENDFTERLQQQSEKIFQLEEENSELKTRVQKFQDQIKVQMFQTQSVKEESLQHKRSKSDFDTDLLDVPKPSNSNEDISSLKETLQQEQAKNQLLQYQLQEISNRETNAKKEFERLKQHLIEVEDHYTEEAVENEKVINDLKSKLVIAEEQLQHSSTYYTSLKVRDNQHLESLQSQIKMISAQRDDFQSKLSAAEDEVQKHKASLMSLQIVLEQFQQDKERELEELGMKYERELHLQENRFKELEMEIQTLKNQLMEAKNGLKAASRLGEQLEKKTQQVNELEGSLSALNCKVEELEKRLATADQASNGKIDKSLIKNLVVGYILSSNADRKSQVLRIMASVLDFDQEERNKMGVDASKSGWLSNILHPKADGPPSSQSLSEAFIKFLESESRPQPQLKLLPEQVEPSTSKTSRTSPKPSGRLSELMLPTFNSSQENESSIILKNVLRDS